MDQFLRDVSGIAELDDDVRRTLYRYVCEQTTPVGRDQAATALGLPRHTVKFHLDRLETAGLLQADYVRLTGRSGPGAGRPAKVYQRAAGEFSVSLPGRDYALAADLMAEAITVATDHAMPVQRALAQVARARGAAMASQAGATGTALERARDAVHRSGYEPHEEAGRIVMGNCPFHSLAQTHTQLVCEMNHALLTGMCECLGSVRADLAPAPHRCCVVLVPDG